MGGLVGTAVEHTAGDTTAYEYIVRKENGDLLSVAQRDVSPLALCQKVLVITGNQARVVADYTIRPEPARPHSSEHAAQGGSGRTAAAAETATPPLSVPEPAPPPETAKTDPNTAGNPPSPPASPP